MSAAPLSTFQRQILCVSTLSNSSPWPNRLPTSLKRCLGGTGRKNIGYLYAIAHGAKMIWDFDDDNILRPGVVPAVPRSEVYQVQLDPAACVAFNPYPLMGGPSYIDPHMPPSWPRGFPLDLILKPCSFTLLPGNISSVAIVQSLAQNDPDVDGIYRLTCGMPVDFDQDSRSTLIIPPGTLTPWNAQASDTQGRRPALLSGFTPAGMPNIVWQTTIYLLHTHSRSFF